MTKVFALILWVALIISYSPIDAQSWTKSFTAGGYDSSGEFLGGSEVLQLISHKNKLYASVGYWQDGNNIWYGGTNFSIGWGQIIRLDSPTDDWQEDLFLGANYLRPELLKQIIITKDATGIPLATPDTILIAAGYSPNYFNSTVTVSSFVRNDENMTWGESQIIQGGFSAGEHYSIRDLEVYTDLVTGLEYIIASVGTQGIFKGKYNPNIPGKIDWISSPEFGPLSIRPLGIAIANDALYFSSGNKLYMRDDGTTATYSIAHDFSDLSSTINSAVGGIRGLTTIANQNGNNDALLLMWCPNGQSEGIIYRLEPDGVGGFTRIYETKISLLVENYLPGSNANYVLGAYNEFYSYIDPLTSETIHLVGFEANITGGGHPTWNGYYSGGLFATRNSNIEYSIEEINGTIEVNDPPLVANRCYVASPFQNEHALYYGGFDPNSNSSTNRAWIYKKTLQTECPYDNTFHSDITPTNLGDTHTELCGIAGEYYSINVLEGETYIITACNGGNTTDTQLTLYTDTGTTALAYNDNDCGEQATITWVATLTGTVHLLLDEWSNLTACSSGATCTQIEVTWGDSCPDNYSLTGEENMTVVYETNGMITSTQVLSSSAQVNYDAGSVICLDSGFEVQLGAKFDAFIDGCNNGLGGGQLQEEEDKKDDGIK